MPHKWTCSEASMRAAFTVSPLGEKYRNIGKNALRYDNLEENDENIKKATGDAMMWAGGRRHSDTDETVHLMSLQKAFDELKEEAQQLLLSAKHNPTCPTIECPDEWFDRCDAWLKANA